MMMEMMEMALMKMRKTAQEDCERRWWYEQGTSYS